MELSILLAKYIGALFVVVGIGVIINPNHYARMTKSFIHNAELYYFSGATAFIVGLTLILYHNLWVADWRIAITILGWLALLKGVFRIIFPTIGADVADALLLSKQVVYVTGAISLIFGLWMCTKGF